MDKGDALRCAQMTVSAIRQNRVFAPPEMHKMIKEDLGKVYYYINGCGTSLAKFDFVPDRIYGTYIGEACGVHDWMYFFGRTLAYKDQADRIFLNNMLRIIEEDCKKKWYKPKFLMRRRAYKYYLAVKHFGGPSFWDDKNPSYVEETTNEETVQTDSSKITISDRVNLD